MKLTVIAPAAEVHRAGCADIARTLRNGRTARGEQAEFGYDVTADNCAEVAADFWADFIDEGSMTPERALDSTHFLPCIPASFPTHAPTGARYEVGEVSVGAAGLTARPAVIDTVTARTVKVFTRNHRAAADRLAAELNAKEASMPAKTTTSKARTTSKPRTSRKATGSVKVVAITDAKGAKVEPIGADMFSACVRCGFTFKRPQRRNLCAVAAACNKRADARKAAASK